MVDARLDDGQLAGIVADVPDALVIVDDRGTIVFTNPAVRDVLGYEPEQLVGEHLAALVPEESRAVHAVQFQGFVEQPVARPMGIGLELRARRRDGSLVPVEVALVPVRGKQFTAAFVRDVSERRRLVDRLVASNELTTALASGASRDAAIALGVGRARALLDGNDAWLTLIDPSAGTPDVVIGGGNGGDTMVTEVGAGAHRRVADSVGDGEACAGVGPDDRVAACGIRADVDGPWLIAPFGTPLRGVLVATRPADGPPFADSDARTAMQLAAEVGIALDLVDTRAAAERVSLLAEHERIARDLHDTVIQTVFAEGLRLQATAQLADPVVAERIQRSVDNLDAVIREIRTAIFHLQSAATNEGGLRAAVLDLTDEMTEPAALQARVAFSGSVEERTPTALGEVLLTVLRETLSNVVRHSAATRLDVVVDIDDEHLRLTVSDDGVGPPDHPTAGVGLLSLQARAIELGGSFTFRRRHDDAVPPGSVVRWAVPLPAAADQ